MKAGVVNGANKNCLQGAGMLFRCLHSQSDWMLEIPDEKKWSSVHCTTICIFANFTLQWKWLTELLSFSFVASASDTCFNGLGIDRS